ncbi:MAG TPA: glycosyltransferase family 39 protein [Terracidiphilus sp.]
MSQLTAPRPARISPPGVISALCALIAGAALRFWMLHKFFEVNGDSQLYGGMAKNLLLHGQYAIGNGELHATLIRLPGYPLFLAACFRVFGMENYFAPACIQIAAELAACILLALLALRLSNRPAAAQATLWLACLCPFTAIYAAEPLTEAPTLFCIALALWAVARFQDRRDWLSALAFTFAVTCAALLRPDGALVGIAFAPPIAHALWHSAKSRADLKGHGFSPAESRSKMIWALAPEGSVDQTAARGSVIRKVLICLLLALAPFAAWTYRNWRVFHVFQPLAPRYATDPGEPTWPGWQRWTKTWCLDFVSTYQVYWNLPDAPLDIHQLPSRAFDSPAQYAQTAKLFADYEANGEDLSAAIDDGFAQLAQQRIAAHPLRYYLLLPTGRVADMLFRPRVENLPIDLDWWIYSHHWAETRFSWSYAALNALYFLLALAGLCLRPRLWQSMVIYFLLRCILLATIESPEARYTLEFFPMFFVLGGLAIAKIKRPGALAPSR